MVDRPLPRRSHRRIEAGQSPMGGLGEVPGRESGVKVAQSALHRRRALAVRGLHRCPTPYRRQLQPQPLVAEGRHLKMRPRNTQAPRHRQRTDAAPKTATTVANPTRHLRKTALQGPNRQPDILYALAEQIPVGIGNPMNDVPGCL